MVAKKITSKENIYQKRELSYDEWIDENMKRIYNHSKDRISYVSRKGRSPNKLERDKIIDELSVLDLADANALGAELTSHGEKVCTVGGWIAWKKREKQKSQQSPNIGSLGENQSLSLNRKKETKSIPEKLANVIVEIIIGVVIVFIGTLLWVLFEDQVVSFLTGNKL